MKKNTRVLVIDDEPNELEMLRLQLMYEGFDVTVADGGLKGLKLAEGNQFDLILTDLHMPDLNGIELVDRIKKQSPELQIILISGHGRVPDAVKAIKAGAYEFILKPVDFTHLFVLMEKALEMRELTRENRSQAEEIGQLRKRLSNRDSYFEIVGSSKAMLEIFELIDSVADSDANVLIIGESGTGKEMIANAVHFRSNRAKKPFVKINCAALPKELIESELFGHTKGAFTGAATDKIGLIGQANGGSLLLDEIGEMPLDLQPKILRVLQERVYTRLGTEKPQPVDFRLISSTNRDPLDAVAEGRLREDLYYRINTILIDVPPLRERAEDIQNLTEHFLRVFAVKYQMPAREFSQSAWGRIFEHTWPGNVRELQNVVERAVLLSKAPVIEADALPFSKSTVPPAAATTPPAPRPMAPEQPAPVAAPPLPATLRELCQSIVKLAPLPQVGAESMTFFEQIEGPLVQAALERTNGNKQAAAALLGIYRPRLYNILKRHNLETQQGA